MASPNLSDLLKPQTATQQRTTLLTRLGALGFPTMDWQDGSVPRTLVELIAQGLADASTLVATIVAGGLLGYAKGDWLTLLASQFFAIDRNLRTYTYGYVTLTASPTAGLQTITAGQLWFQSTSGRRFTNATGGTLDPSGAGTLVLQVQAESPGAAYNVGVGTITTMLTPLPGVTVSNPIPSGLPTWISSYGTDDESDDQLVARCRARWPSLGSAPPGNVYDLWARTASPSVTRTRVVPDGVTPGQTDVYLAGAGGGVTTDVVATVQAYIDPRTPTTSTTLVQSATSKPVQVTYRLYVNQGYEASASAAADAALGAYVNGVDVGGTVYLSDVMAALQNPAGVRNVELDRLSDDGTATVADVALQVFEVAVLSATATVISV